MSFCFSQ